VGTYESEWEGTKEKERKRERARDGHLHGFSDLESLKHTPIHYNTLQHTATHLHGFSDLESLEGSELFQD